MVVVVGLVVRAIVLGERPPVAVEWPLGERLPDLEPKLFRLALRASGLKEAVKDGTGGLSTAGPAGGLNREELGGPAPPLPLCTPGRDAEAGSSSVLGLGLTSWMRLAARPPVSTGVTCSSGELMAAPEDMAVGAGVSAMLRCGATGVTWSKGALETAASRSISVVRASVRACTGVAGTEVAIGQGACAWDAAGEREKPSEPAGDVAAARSESAGPARAGACVLELWTGVMGSRGEEKAAEICRALRTCSLALASC